MRPWEDPNLTVPEKKVVGSAQGAWIIVNGKRVLNLCSNNYLGLAGDPKIGQAAIGAIKKYGVGPGAVRALSGNSILHEELETRLAKFKHTEAALVVQGGYIANLVAIQTLMGKEDIVISDELNHASIIDAIRLAGIKNKFIYKHNEMADLEAKLKEVGVTDKQVMIVTDGVFSMDGDIARLPQIVELAKKYNAITVVDDAHGEGVLGNGRGIVEHFGLHGQVDVEVGTLSKAFGVVGGVIAGKKQVIDYLQTKARQFLFSTGISIPDAAALIAGVTLLEESDELVKKLWENGDYLKSEFKKAGFDTGVSETPITPVMIGEETKAIEFSRELFAENVFATPIKFPMVALGKARIRVMPSAAHSKEDLDTGIAAFTAVGKKLKVI
ncbi:8-amino-7-oxononanoate synthase [Candidatus Collierbacteria bacterium RIFOXYA1_FULL_46_24]|nr:MAG: 8-amino-7-oxononanoate synthase [Candidatus Collierbacteria bacterium RIFOXYA1_FULL_46_24]